MLVTLLHIDGSEQTMDVASLRLSVSDRPVEITPDNEPSRIRLQSLGDDEEWQQLVVHLGAANVMTIEVLSHKRIDRLSVTG